MTVTEPSDDDVTQTIQHGGRKNILLVTSDGGRSQGHRRSGM